jgi:arylsulfatase A-like enzyme/tetratricopeptide (TPR) repeat protein
VSKQPRRARPAAGHRANSNGQARTWAVAVAAVVLLAAGAYWWMAGRGAAYTLAANPDQNIVLVTIDTLRADALSSYGGQARTPHLDALAARGARFTFAHAHAPVTLPSHTSILSGLLPYEHRVRDNSGFRVPDGTPTLATRLKPLGFATGAFIGGFPLSKRFGLTPGFDTYDDQIPELGGDRTYSMPERPANEVVSRAVAWIGQQPGKFFQWVHVFDAHSPYRPPPPFDTQYAAQPYFGEVAFIDQSLQPLFDRLATLSRPTTVIVTADHGESLGEHGEATHGMFAYDATIRVPLIIATITPATATAPRGVVIDTPARSIDIAPTVLDAIGQPADPKLSGSSLRPVIAGDTADRPMYFEAMTYNLVRGWAPLRGVIAGKKKFIDLPIPELYNLVTDPAEQTNLAGGDPPAVAMLTATLGTYDRNPPNRPGVETAENVAALKALGYISGTAAAKDVYTEADDPKTLSQLDRDLHTASELTQRGQVDAAIEVMKKVIAARPDTTDAYLSLAYAYWNRGQTREAIETLESGLRAGAPDRDIRIRLGIYLSETHTDPGRAVTLLTGLPVSDVEALNALGIAYIDSRRYADAVAAFKRVLALDATNGLAFQNLAASTLKQALESGKPSPAAFATAEDYARKAIDADPTLAGAYTTLGVIMSNTGRKPDAILAWARAVELDPGDFNALYNLWLELARAGRRDEASRYAQQFLATAPPAFFATERAEIAKYLNK